jgi:predicted phosphodiesterase
MVVHYIRILAFSLILLFSSFSAHSQGNNTIRIGIFTDCQYCNCTESGDRYYKLSLAKLDSCINEFNSQPLDAVFHLGDMIDHNFGSFDSVLPGFRKFKSPLHLVLGNHDYMIKPEYKPGLTDYIGMKETYYKVDIGNWSFIVLNGDDLSCFAPQSKKQKRERNEMILDLYSGLQGNGMPWNGGIGSDQMNWLDSQLSKAQDEKRNVIVICHFSLFSKKDHNLYNNNELFQLMNCYPCVKGYFNGHYHAGNYQEKEGIHLVNFKGMVSTKQNAFSVVTLTSDSILIKGYGREPSRRLGIRK